MDEWLKADEIAQRLKVKPETVRAWARRRLIPAIRINCKTVRFDFDEVRRALIARNRLPSQKGARPE